MKFEKYQHVERLGTEATDGILDGTCYVFPKLDGTNTSVYLNDDGNVEVASRNRVLSIHDDNQGVCNFVLNNPQIIKYVHAHPNRRLFGEWLVPHTIRTYLPRAWRKLYIFDVMEDGKYLTYDEYYDELLDYEIPIVKCMEQLENPTPEQIQTFIDRCTFLMQDGQIGEGIVIKRYDFVNRFGRTTWAKIVRPHVKAAQKIQRPLNTDCVETQIIDAFLTPEFVEKEFAKIAADGWNNKLIGKFLNVTWHTFIDEETFNILRKFHNPKIDFAFLNQLAVSRIKEIKADLF